MTGTVYAARPTRAANQKAPAGQRQPQRLAGQLRIPAASFPLLHPTEAWKPFPTDVSATDSLTVNPNFYVFAKRAPSGR